MDQFKTFFIPYIVPSLNEILTMRLVRKYDPRAKYKTEIHRLVEIELQNNNEQYKEPVCISYYPILGTSPQPFDKAKNAKRAYDVDNYASSIKYITDAFKHNKLFENDDVRFIKSNYTHTPTKWKNEVSGILVIIEINTIMSFNKHIDVYNKWINKNDK